MEEKIKAVIAGFIKKDASLIDANTVIDKTALKSSILVHRMYGELSNAGFLVTDYLTIKTYGELLTKTPGQSVNEVNTVRTLKTETPDPDGSVGIDIETMDRLPAAADYREDGFYKMNFSQREISYCLLQSDTRKSFTGLFAAKEAIVKSYSRYREVPFSQIEIDHDRDGKPLCEGFSISISYLETIAVAVAVRNAKPSANSGVDTEQILKKAKDDILILNGRVKTYSLVTFIAIVSALAAICLALIF